MKELEVLLENRWVLKSENKDLYYRIRDGITEIRRFATEKLGCQVIENSLMVKLEKIPAIPESCMGISGFKSNEEYAFLCVLLMFLEDKDAEEQFILSQLTEYISSNMPGQTVDWTLYTNRRRLINVLRYAENQGIIRVTDGNDDAFMDEQSGEVLYENTGVSKYFMRNFTWDIMSATASENFMGSDWFDIDEDRGIARRHRVYKRLFFSLGMYMKSGSYEDFEYLKNQGRRLIDELEQNFDCRVHIHKGSAFILMGENCHMGISFPGNNAMSDVILLCCKEIRKNVESGTWKTQNDDTVIADRTDFENMIKTVKKVNGAGFTKSLREMPDGEFVNQVMEQLRWFTFVECDEREHQVIIFPSAGKMAGAYPNDFLTREESR